MKVLIAPDKFKGTLAAAQAARGLARGWRRARPRDTLRLLPISDGGDGFGAALGDRLGARLRRVSTVDAAHRPLRARWWWEPRSRTAIVESARVVGLAMLPPGRFHPFALDTEGFGMALRHAAASGARRCIVGLGGSATNDGGFGMARALGWRFLDAGGEDIEQWTELTRLHTLVRPETPLGFREVLAAVDVQNPLLGRLGATRIYGPQKGVRPEDYDLADKCLGALARVVRRTLGLEYAKVPGAGAAGGLGFGMMAFASARLTPGFDLFAAEAGLGRQLEWADVVVTGEGSVDESTLMGKGVGQLARRCRKLGKPCIGIGGAVTLKPGSSRFFASVLALTSLTSVEEAKARAAYWLERLAAQAARQFRPGT